MIADSSAWIDFFRRTPAPWVESLGRASADGDLVVGDLILAEVLQGARSSSSLREVQAILLRLDQVSLCGPEIAVKAAENYRRLRSRGVTVRGTIDVVIATWCIENGAAIIHNDRDMAAMERELGLRAYG